MSFAKRILMPTFRISICLVAFLVFHTLAFGSDDNVVRRALLIGVSEYEKAGFSSLKYPEADVTGIEAELKKAGFKTTLMLSSLDESNPLRATKTNIERQLLSPTEFRAKKSQDKDLHPGFVAGLGELKKSDLVLVVLAGHGRQELVANAETNRKEAAPFFCPTDANRSDSETWVSINRVMKNVSEYSGSEKNLILIDACRDNPSRGRGIDGKSVSITADNLGICFSSSAGTESYESDKLKHGLFSYYVIEGLKGKAKDFRNDVTWSSLTGYVQAMVSEQAPALVERKQSPHVAGSLKAAPVLIPNANIIVAKQPANKIGETKSTPKMIIPSSRDLSEKNRDSNREAGNSLGKGELESEVKRIAKDLLDSKTQLKELTDRFDDSHPSVVMQQRKVSELEFKLLKLGVLPKAPVKKLTTYQSKSIGMEFVRIEAGSFQMGSSSKNAFPSAKPRHPVIISKPFFIGKYEVTQKEWKSLMGTEPWKDRLWVKSGVEYAATSVSWDDAVAFCKKLSTRDGRTYRLPTEAEWEYACRGGTDTEFSFGDSDSSLGGFAWYDGNASDIDEKYAHRVGQMGANPFGLYDLHGNVMEWCQDYYGGDYYGESVKKDPINLSGGNNRVVRGGSWNSKSIYCSSFYRNSYESLTQLYYIGFRVVCENEK